MRCGIVSAVTLAIYRCKYIKGNKCIVSSLNELSNPNVSADEAILYRICYISRDVAQLLAAHTHSHIITCVQSFDINTY